MHLIDSISFKTPQEVERYIRRTKARFIAGAISQQEAAEQVDMLTAVAARLSRKDTKDPQALASNQTKTTIMQEKDFITLHKKATAARAVIAVKQHEHRIVIEETREKVSMFWGAVFRLMEDTRCRIDTVLSLMEKDVTTETEAHPSGFLENKHYVILTMQKESDCSKRNKENHALKVMRESRKREAKITDNLREYVRVSEMADDDLYEILTEREKKYVERYKEKSSPYVKKFEISFGTFLLLKDLMEKENPTTEGYVFAAARTGSHRAAKSTSKVSRQAAWKMLNRCPQTKEILGGLLKQ